MRTRLNHIGNMPMVESIKDLKRKVIPSGRMILFGSHARGDARQDSDWDVVMLLNKDKLTSNDFDTYAYPFVEMGWKQGEYISIKQYTVADWEKRKGTPFYQNVTREGIEL